MLSLQSETQVTAGTNSFFPLAGKRTGKTLSNYTSVSGELPFITIRPLSPSFDFLIEGSQAWARGALRRQENKVVRFTGSVVVWLSGPLSSGLLIPKRGLQRMPKGHPSDLHITSVLSLPQLM